MLFINGKAITSRSMFEKFFSPEAVIIQRYAAVDFINMYYAPVSIEHEVHAKIFGLFAKNEDFCQRIYIKERWDMYISSLYSRILKNSQNSEKYSSRDGLSKVEQLIDNMRNNEKIVDQFNRLVELLRETSLNDFDRQRVFVMLLSVYILADKTFDDYPISAENAEKAFLISKKALHKENFNAEETAFMKSVMYGEKKAKEEATTVSAVPEKPSVIPGIGTEEKNVEIKEFLTLENEETKLYGVKNVVYRLQLSENPVFGADDEIVLKRITAVPSRSFGAPLPVKIEIYSEEKKKLDEFELQTGEYIYMSCLNNKIYYVHPLASGNENNTVKRRGNTVFWNYGTGSKEFESAEPVVGFAAEKKEKGFVFVTPYGACYNDYSGKDVMKGFLMEEDVVEVAFVDYDMYVLDKYGDIYDGSCNQVSEKKYIKLSDYFGKEN